MIHDVKSIPRERVKISLTFTSRHVQHMAENLREADKRELELITGVDPVTELSDSIMNSWWLRMAYTERDRKITPVAFYGISDHPQAEWFGIPWMVATDEAERFARDIVYYSKDFMHHHTQRYGYMENHVHFENEKSIRLLEHLGFTVDEPEPWGVQNALFRRFHWSK